MTRKLVTTKKIKKLLGIEDEIDVVYDRDKVSLRRPLTIPEPSTLALAALGVLGLLGARLLRRRS